MQDELHLISGPLGTMVGLYEAAIDSASVGAMATADVGPRSSRSTATVRRATEQIRALFGRTRQPALFPPPGVDDGEQLLRRALDRSRPAGSTSAWPRPGGR